MNRREEFIELYNDHCHGTERGDGRMVLESTPLMRFIMESSSIMSSMRDCLSLIKQRLQKTHHKDDVSFERELCKSFDVFGERIRNLDVPRSTSLFERHEQRNEMIDIIMEQLNTTLQGLMARWEEGRVRTKHKQVLQPQKSRTQASKGIAGKDVKEERLIVLTPQQQQSMSQMMETHSLLSEYTAMSSILISTESTLTEISRLQATLAFHLSTQAAQIERLWDDAVLASDTVTKGNKELRRARERGGGLFRGQC